MSHIRPIVPQPLARSEVPYRTYSEGEPLLLRSHDCHWEDHWQDSFRRLKVATEAYDAARREGAEPSLIEQLELRLTQRELEIHRAFLSQFRTTDDYAAWRLSILDLELRWFPGRPHKMASGLPMAEIMRRLDAVRVYALGPPLSSPTEPPPESRRVVIDILEQPPAPEIIRMAARLRRQGGDEARPHPAGCHRPSPATAARITIF